MRAAAVLLSAWACVARAAPVELHGYFVGALGWSTVEGSGGRVSGLTSGSRAGPSVDQIEVDAVAAVAGFHARLGISAGDAFDALHAPPPGDHSPAQPTALAHLAQAWLGYTAPVGRGLTIDAGLMPSHIGYETFPTVDNWNFSHAWMAELSPYYQAGVRVSYPFSRALQVELLWLNGWGVVERDHGFASGGAQIAWSTDLVSGAANFFVGPVRPNGGVTDGLRGFGDLWLAIVPTPSLRCAAVLDGGFDDLAGASTFWWAGGTYVRYQAHPRLAVAVRADLYDDRDGGTRSGAAQRLLEGTITADLLLGAVTVRAELRYDHSTDPTLDGQTGRLVVYAVLAGRL